MAPAALSIPSPILSCLIIAARETCFKKVFSCSQISIDSLFSAHRMKCKWAPTCFSPLSPSPILPLHTLNPYNKLLKHSGTAQDTKVFEPLNVVLPGNFECSSLPSFTHTLSPIHRRGNLYVCTYTHTQTQTHIFTQIHGNLCVSKIRMRRKLFLKVYHCADAANW